MTFKRASLALLLGSVVAAGAVQAANARVACNAEGDCWHVAGNWAFEPGFGVKVYGDDWKWKTGENYRWREHEGHGYWRQGTWIEIR